MGIGKVEALPHLAFVGLSVAHHAEDVVGAAVDLVAKSRAHSGGHALTQRAGGQIHAGGQLAVGVAGELGVGMVEGISLLHRIVAHDAEGGIGNGAGVTLGQDQPVAVFPAGVLGVKFHDLAIKDGHQVGQIHGAAHMAEPTGVDDLQGLQTNLSCQDLAVFLIHRVFLPFLF